MEKETIGPNPSVSVKFRDDVTIGQSAARRLILSRRGLKALEVLPHPLIDRLMKNWMTEAQIDRSAGSDGNPRLLYLLYEKLVSLDLLQARCTLDGDPLFSLLPAPEWSALRKEAPPAMARLSCHAGLRREGRDLILEMPLSKRKLLIHDQRCLQWIMGMARETPSAAAGDGASLFFFRALSLIGALDGGEPARGGWEPHDLTFFHQSSIGFHDDPIGAMRPLEKMPPSAPVFKPSTGETVLLPEPGQGLMEKLRAPFAEVLAHRRSGRIAGDNPPTIEELSALLHASARVQEIKDDAVHPWQVSLRPSPSGGALHSLEIYPLVRKCTGLAPGAWRYDPAGHRLEAIPADDRLLDEYLKTNPYMLPDLEPPHIRMVITSRFQRNSWKYEKIALRLVLQDLGCLCQTLSLTATALGMASCILGTVDARRLGEVLGLEPLIEPIIGEMTLSSP
ncbi:MAG TPA: SagB family peptide dehydrogenase [Syntrophorhabdaceae bacterium]